jgi:predicted RNase H-like HicB family nuclease
VDEPRTRVYKVVVEPDEDGMFIATVPSVPGVVEQGETVEEAFKRIREALAFHLTCMTEEGEEIPPSDTPDPRQVRDLELAI